MEMRADRRTSKRRISNGPRQRVSVSIERTLEMGLSRAGVGGRLAAAAEVGLELESCAESRSNRRKKDGDCGKRGPACSPKRSPGRLDARSHFVGHLWSS